MVPSNLDDPLAILTYYKRGGATIAGRNAFFVNKKN
jgi:hypothetical protein